MTNNIRKIKQDLRAYAKRCKDVHYTESLFLKYFFGFISYMMIDFVNEKFNYHKKFLTRRCIKMTNNIRKIKQDLRAYAKRCKDVHYTESRRSKYFFGFISYMMIDFVNEKFNYHKKFLTRRCIKMTNNIRKIKQDLRAYAKRCKDVHYTESLVITFLITGMLFTTSNLFSAPTNTSIENQRQTISTSIKTIHQQVKATRKENDKLLKNTNLELIQLMEQGDHVVKSPWSSWQYGINYFNNNWNGTYKGRGDKKAKYPYEGIFQRSQNIYERAISPDSSNYGMLSRNRRPNFASGSAAGYGIASVKPVKEPIVPFEVNAGIRPRSINKSAIRIADKTAVTPTLPEAISFTPPKPVIGVPKDPFTPNPPTFSVILGADCNEGCDSNNWREVGAGLPSDPSPRQKSQASFVNNNTGNQNITTWLHYTWTDGAVSPAEQRYAFKMYAETDTKDITDPKFVAGRPGHSQVGANSQLPAGVTEYNFNSYNFGNAEFNDPIKASQDAASPIDRNKQYFFIGGSRFWEIDNFTAGPSGYNPSKVYEFPGGRTLNLGGILTLGMVSQQNSATLKNSGTITDKTENTHQYIRNITQKYDTNLTFNADGTIASETSVTPGTGHYLKIYGPASSVYYIKKSEDGYVGYKVGIAQVYENGNDYGQEDQILENAGKIDFRGERSIGIYTYIPNDKSYVIMKNDSGATISMSGKESYGMKFAAKKGSDRASMINAGTIELRVNPDGNKKDKADNSAAMALMEDASVTNKVSMDRGKAVNEGTIKLSGVQNSLGMFVNVDSNMTNKGKIKIDSDIAKVDTDQPMNVAMRADYGTGKGGSTTVGSNAEVINDANGEISLKGNFAIGQLARLSTATNKTGGKIITDNDIKNSVGMSTLGGALNNDGEITLKGSGVSNNIGAFLNSYKLSTTTYNPKGKLGANSRITVSGDSSTGVLINGSSTGTTASLEYGGTVTATGNGVSGMTIGDNNTGKAEVTAKNDGTVTVNGGNASTSAGVYEYMDGKNKVRKGSYGIVVSKNSSLVSHGGKNVNVDVNVKGSESIGLYSGENATLEVGNHTVKAYDGAVNYDADKGKITLKGTGTATTGQKSLLFYLGENGTGKVSIDGTMTATIEGGTTPNTRGNAFYYVGNGGDFGKTQIEDWAKNNFGNGSKTTLGNLTLNMNKGSRLFIAQNVGMNLSDTTGDAVSKATGAHINGTDYKTFMLYLSKLTINQNVNLDAANDAYNQLEISNSSITNANTKTITGTKASQVAMAQENNSTLYARKDVTLSNEGTINLSGAGSTGMYTKFGELYNKATGVMTIGDKSTAIYGTEDSLLENAGKITIGSNSTGLYSEGSKSQAIKNTGTIETSGNDSVAMSYKPDASLSPGVTLENAGKITMTGDRNTAIYATGTPGYTAKNSGTVTLGNSAAISSPNVGLYTDHNTVTLENTGTISSGNNTIGIYGHNVNNAGNLNIGNAAVGIYSQSGNVNLTGGTITTGTDEAVGVYTVGSGQTVTNSGTAFNIGNNSFGFVNVGTGNKITSSISNVGLGNNNVYMYSSDTKGTVTNATNITSTGEQNYGIYSAGTVTNTGNINLSSGKGSVAIYSIKGGTATNYGTITVGESDVPSSLYSIGMGAGYTTTDTGNIVNRGTINVNGKHSIGMYASGAGSTATNDGNIVLNASNTTGIYADNGATVINNKSITTGSGTYTNTVGVYLGKDSKLINNKGATIDINAKNGVGVYLKGGTVANYGTMRVNGSTRDEDTIYEFTVPSTGKGVGGVNIDAPAGAKTATITVNGVPQTPTVVNTTGRNPITVSASSIGLYVNTSGVNYTKSIDGLQKLTSEADLIIGAEAAESTNSKYILVNDPKIINPYRKAMLSNPNIKWNVYSGSIGWIATPTLDSDGVITSLYMAKIPYTNWAGKQATPVNSTDTYNFTDGLEQRYGVKALGTRERLIFKKLNGIGNNEEVLLYQAFDEMMGHQYGNLQQRINATGNLLDKEFRYLKHDWRNPSKQNNKIKVFGMRDEYNTDTAGIINYTSNAYGVAYVHEDEKIKMGNSSGWYAGAVTNRFKFKDIGKSKENQTILKAGV
ncbi:autotransporter-associated N-terminal domain-containing protein, partial [Leptotrichia trevisanii]|uniref:autotransporter-associated N-terminal domain-containing protein n=1 Tax=Leptotrichia trevisanii TaxID=109328 RepID=UPI000683DD35